MKNKIIIKYILSFLGFIIVVVFLYINFIRERLPKDIPFTLTEYSFWILVYICVIYLFIIKQILYPRTLNNLLIQKIMSSISKPFIIFDSSIKHYTKIFPYYLKFMYKIIEKLDTFSSADYVLIMYLLQIVPRVILVLILITDVFLLHHIFVYYYFIILGIISFLYLYFKYSLNFACEQFIIYLEKSYEQVYVVQVFSSAYYDTLEDDELPTFTAPYHDKIISLREYVELQSETKTIPFNNWYYEGSPLAKEEIYNVYRKENNKINGDLTNDDHEIIDNDFYTIIPFIITLKKSLIIEKNSQKIAYIPTVKIIINIMYLTCWVYILYVSYATVKDFNISLTLLNIINNYNIEENMFTGLFENYNIPINIDKSYINYLVNNLIYYFNKFYLIKIIIPMSILTIFNNENNFK